MIDVVDYMYRLGKRYHYPLDETGIDDKHIIYEMFGRSIHGARFAISVWIMVIMMILLWVIPSYILSITYVILFFMHMYESVRYIKVKNAMESYEEL